MSLSLVVGLSGGLDSTVLLHLLHRMQRKAPQEFSLSAMHVHHGLQPAADDFVAACERLCKSLALPLLVARVAVDPQEIADLGLEAAARRHRYQAIAERMPPSSALVLAHHRDDLLETVLLQWIRGAGLEGLTGMAALSQMDVADRSITIWRPMLDCGREALLAYAQAHQLSWIEDPSNADPDLARNRIRRDVMPVLRGLRTGADVAMARSIAHLQSARGLLESFTARELDRCRLPHGGISVKGLLAQDDAMALRMLRAWIRESGAPTPPARRIEEFLRQLRQAREPFARMDLDDPATGETWHVARDKAELRIGR
jgi:tRNA(Ile)-lysidine synthase